MGLAGVILCFGAIVFFSLIEPNIPGPTPKKGDPPDFEFTQIRLVQFEKGKPSLNLKAKKAQIDKDKNHIALQGVEGMLHGADKPLASFLAPTVSMPITTANLVLSKAVVQFYGAGDRVQLATDQLTWDAVKKEFTGKGGVTVSSPRMTVRGDHFLASIPFKRMSIQGSGKAVFHGQ